MKTKQFLMTLVALFVSFSVLTAQAPVKSEKKAEPAKKECYDKSKTDCKEHKGECSKGKEECCKDKKVKSCKSKEGECCKDKKTEECKKECTKQKKSAPSSKK